MIAVSLALALLTTPPGTRTQSWKIESPNQYRTTGDYPILPGSTTLVTTANNALRAAAYGPRDEFIASAKEFWESERGSRAWEQEIGSEIHYFTSRIISAATSIYEYTGGAHPNSRRLVMGWVVNGRRVESVGLQHFLLGRNDRITFAQMSLLERINDEKRDRGLDPLDEFDYDLLNRFVVGERGLTWLFDRYQIGSYAEGEYEVYVPFTEIAEFESATPLCREMAQRR